VHVFTCLFLIGVVLLQQGKGQDLASAFGGGGSQTAFGPRGSATVLSRATTILAALFMVTSFSLSVIKSGRSTILDQVPAATATEAPAAATEEPASTTEKPAGATEAPAEPAQAPAPAEETAGEPAKAPASE
jgi:preprotein translocase subunit SecG